MLGTKVIIYSDHAAIHYLMTKKELHYEDLGISLPELYEQMGYGEVVPDEATVRETENILSEVKDFLKPRFCFFVVRELPDFSIGQIIERQLRGSEAYALFICTAGTEYEEYLKRLKEDGDMVRVFIADALGSVIAEKTADCMEKTLQENIEKLAKADIVGGFPDGTFRPDELVTRAQASVFVKNLLDAMGE